MILQKPISTNDRKWRMEKRITKLDLAWLFAIFCANMAPFKPSGGIKWRIDCSGSKYWRQWLTEIRTPLNQGYVAGAKMLEPPCFCRSRENSVQLRTRCRKSDIFFNWNSFWKFQKKKEIKSTKYNVILKIFLFWW